MTAHDAQRVVVVEDGRIAEAGTHDELVQNNGAYAALWRSWRDATATFDLGGFCSEQDANAVRFDLARQHLRGARIELTLHQSVHEMNKRDLGAALGEAVRGLEPQQSTADDDGARPVGGAAQLGDVGKIAKDFDTAQIHARRGETDRARAGRNDELRVGNARPVGEAHPPDCGIDRSRRLTVQHGHAAIAPPARRLELDVGGGNLVSQQRG
jgi:hypothetical protein